jgi:hypothetical protein
MYTKHQLPLDTILTKGRLTKSTEHLPKLMSYGRVIQVVTHTSTWNYGYGHIAVVEDKPQHD